MKSGHLVTVGCRLSRQKKNVKRKTYLGHFRVQIFVFFISNLFQLILFVCFFGFCVCFSKLFSRRVSLYSLSQYSVFVICIWNLAKMLLFLSLRFFSFKEHTHGGGWVLLRLSSPTRINGLSSATGGDGDFFNELESEVGSAGKSQT